MERTTASLSVHEIATIMSAALGAPPAPPLGCLRLLLGCWQAFTDGRYPQILTDHAELISLWMRFISTTRNINEFSELNQSLHTCRCQANACLRSAPEDLHSHFRDSEPTPQVLVALMCETMRWPWAKRSVTLYRSRVRSAWPRSIHDLVPSDVDSVVFMLLVWITSSDVIMIPVVRLLRVIIDSCKGGGIIGFVKGREIFCAWLKRWISTVGASFRESGSPLQKSDAAMRALAFFHHAGFLIRSMTSIMFDEEFVAWAVFDQQLAHLGSGIMSSLPGMKSAIAQTRSGIYDKHIAANENVWGYIVLRILHCIPELPRGSLYRNVQVAFELNTQRHRNVYHRYATVQSTWQYRCFCPGCVETFPSVGHTFQACGGCKVAHYCSRRCQKLAWRHAASPHRGVCLDMNRLRIALAVYPDPVRQEEELSRTISPANVEAVEAHLSIVKKSKVVLLGTSTLPLDIQPSADSMLADSQLQLFDTKVPSRDWATFIEQRLHTEETTRRGTLT
jgi:hypothetical protein